jgi:hypothetical protein
MEVIIFVLCSYNILVDIPVGKLSRLDQERPGMMELKLWNCVVFMVYDWLDQCLPTRGSTAIPRAIVE